jgi:hypothetical protein
MNGRLEQLAEQCVTRKFYVDHASEEFDYKKFAELVVKECITLGTNFTNRNYSDDAGERIAKHFGVEE